MKRKTTFLCKNIDRNDRNLMLHDTKITESSKKKILHCKTGFEIPEINNKIQIDHRILVRSTSEIPVKKIILERDLQTLFEVTKHNFNTCLCHFRVEYFDCLGEISGNFSDNNEVGIIV